MKKNKTIVLTWMGAFMLATCLLAGGMTAAAEDTPQKEVTGQQNIPVKKQTPEKKPVKTPGTFIPSNKVSADQAVAFPTDI